MQFAGIKVKDEKCSGKEMSLKELAQKNKINAAVTLFEKIEKKEFACVEGPPMR